MKKMIVSNIWEDVWFSSLEPQYKLLWFYIITKIDSKSCWEVNFKNASFHCGFNYNGEQVIKVFESKFVKINDNTWFFPTHIKYHHGNKLSRFSNFHKPVIEFAEQNNLIGVLKKHGIEIVDSDLPIDDEELVLRIRKYWRRLPSPYELEQLVKADKEYLDAALKASSKYNKQSVAYVLAVIEGMKKKKAIEEAKTREAKLRMLKEEERKELESPEIREAWSNIFADLKKQLSMSPNKKNERSKK